MPTTTLRTDTHWGDFAEDSSWGAFDDSGWN